MKNLFRSLMMCCVMLITSMSVSADDCDYYYGYLEGNSPWPYDQYAQGDQMYVEWYINYPDAPETMSLDISTDGGGTWTEVASGLDLEEGYGDWSYAGYTYVTIPWSLQPSYDCLVRYRPVPDNPKECRYNPIGYHYYNMYYGYYPFYIVAGCYQPAILSQPTSQTGCVGFSHTITASADIGPGTPNIQYNWYKDGSLYSSSTSTPNLFFASITSAHAGQYQLRVVNLCGKSQNSNTITLSVASPALITGQPQGSTICPNASGSVTVQATGTSLTYQWRKNGVNIAGATSATYTISSASVADDGSYTCVVRASCGAAVTSAAAIIVVPAPPVITQHPVGGGYCPGSNAVVSCAVTGNGLRYQWYRDEMAIAGGTDMTLTITNIQPKDAGSYWVKITGGAGPCTVVANSLPANVYTYGPPSIKSQPESMDLCNGSEGELVVSADGSNLQYQWFRNGSPVPNSNNYSLRLTGSAGVTGTYTCNISAACNGSITTSPATVTVVKRPVISAQPVGANLQVGDELQLSVTASDGRVITWMRNEQVLATGTSNTYTIPSVSVSDGGYYRAIIENVCGSITSRLAQVLVTDPMSLVPVMEITSEALNIGDVPMGYERERTFENLVMNIGSAPMNVTATSISGADASAFSVIGGGAPFTLAPGESRTIQLRFHPARLGIAQASLDVTSNAAPGSHAVQMRGNGVLLYSTDAILSFGDVRIGESKDDCLNLVNNSATDVTIDQVNLGGFFAGDFTVTTATPLLIGAGQTVQLCMTFAPTAEGSRTCTIDLMSSTGGNSNAGAQGNGQPAVGVIEPGATVGMSLYPNPSAGEVTIKTGDMIARTINVISVTGQVVATITPVTSTVVWNCKTSVGTDVPTGTYNVVISNEAGAYSLPLSIVR